MAYVSVSELSNAISNTLNLLSQYQEAYDGGINVLLTRLHAVDPLHFSDIYNINKVIGELELISTDLNKRYAKYIKQFTNQLNIVNQRKMGVVNSKKLIDKIVKIRTDLSKGILDRNFKSILESYNKIINATLLSIKAHNEIGRRPPITQSILPENDDPPKVMSSDDVDHLNLTILALKRSIDTLVYETRQFLDDTGSVTSSVVEREMRRKRVSSFSSTSSSSYQYDEDPISSNSNLQDVGDVEMTPVHRDDDDYEDEGAVAAAAAMEEDGEQQLGDQNDEKLLESIDVTSRYIHICEQLTSILQLLKENQVPPLADTAMSENLSELLTQMDDTIKLHFSEMHQYLEAFNSPQILKRIEQLEKAISKLGSKFDKAEDDKLEYIRLTFKREIETQLKSVIATYVKEVATMDYTENPSIVKMQGEIISNIHDLILSQLMNEENIVNLLRGPFEKLETQTAGNLTSLIQTISNEFHTYIENLKHTTTEIVERNSAILKTNEMKLEEVTALLKQYKTDYERSKASMLKAMNKTKSDITTTVQKQTEQFKSEMQESISELIDVNFKSAMERLSGEFVQIVNAKIAEFDQRTITMANALENVTIQQNLTLEEAKRVHNTTLTELRNEFVQYKTDMNLLYGEFKQQIEALIVPFQQELTRQNEAIQAQEYKLENFFSDVAPSVIQTEIDQGLEKSAKHLEKVYDSFRVQQLKATKEYYNRFKDMFAEFIAKFDTMYDKVTSGQELLENLKAEIVKERATLETQVSQTAKVEENVRKEVKNTFTRLKNIIDGYLKDSSLSTTNIPTLLKPLNEYQKTYNLTQKTYNLLNAEKRDFEMMQKRLLETLAKRNTSDAEVIKAELENIKAMIDDKIRMVPPAASEIRPVLGAKRKKVEE